MRRADGFHLRRRTADLSEDRGIGRRPARTGPHRLCLHERHVHAEKNEGLPGQRFIRPSSNRSSPSCSTEKLITDKDAETIRKGKQRRAEPVIRPTQMDVLERPYRRPRIHPRSDRRARRRLQGMRRSHQDGEDPRLPGRDQHHRL